LSDLVICVSRAVEQICQDAGLDAERLHVVHDGVDPRRMQHGQRGQGRAALGLDDTTKVLLTVAKLTDHKGHRYMLEAMPRIIRRQPNLVWLVAGDGPLRESLQHLTTRLNVAAHVRFLGYRSDVADLIAAADMMVVPSHLEGLCSSIQDAMFARLPVVATTAGGIPDLLAADGPDGGPAGWLVPSCDPEALAHAVLAAGQFPRLTAQRVEAAHRRAERRFSADRMVERTLQAYEQALHLAPKAAISLQRAA
jgi:glycosyltransferase involved in cell wall biosynthesis